MNNVYYFEQTIHIKDACNNGAETPIDFKRKIPWKNVCVWNSMPVN